MQSYRPVFDTNVLLSAHAKDGGTSSLCVGLTARAEVESVTCEELLDELNEKLVSKLRKTTEVARLVVSSWRSNSQLVQIAGDVQGCVDPDEDMVLECAVLGGATHIVTGDKKHLLPLGSYQGIPIVTPAEFLRIVDESTSGKDS